MRVGTHFILAAAIAHGKTAKPALRSNRSPSERAVVTSCPVVRRACPPRLYFDDPLRNDPNIFFRPVALIRNADLWPDL